MPSRQDPPEFLAGSCPPLEVQEDTVDLAKSAKTDKRQLVVRIKETEKMCCDLRRFVTVKLVRTSPRLEDV